MKKSEEMLRHYDDIGLLKPAEIDDFTGYRYYREEQLFTIDRITSLKDMGVALADIDHHNCPVSAKTCSGKSYRFTLIMRIMNDNVNRIKCRSSTVAKTL